MILLTDLGPIKTMKLYISGPVPSVDFLSSQCSMKEFKPTDWKKEAYRRIDSIRKGNLNVTVQTDKPLRKVQVKVGTTYVLHTSISVNCHVGMGYRILIINRFLRILPTILL